MSLTLRTAVHALLLALSADVALAQQPAAETASAPGAAAIAPKGVAMAPAPSASAVSSAAALNYRSAFEGYRPLTDQPVVSWRESNDLVGRIGGWQSYAREGQGGPPAGSAEAPAPAASQSKSTLPAKPGMPASHDGMGMAPPGSGRPAPMAPVGSNATAPKTPVKMPASRPDPVNSTAPPESATAPAAASAAVPGGHTGHKQP